MKKYEVPVILNGKIVKFVVLAPDSATKYQIKIILTGKFKDESPVVIIDEINQIVKLDFTEEN